MADEPFWTDPLDDTSHVYVPISGLVGVEVSGGDAHLKAGSTDGWIASEVITCPSGYRYDLVYIEADLPGASYIAVSVLDATKDPSVVGYANETIPPHVDQVATDHSVYDIDPATYASIRIQVNLHASGSDMPRVLSWSLYYIGLEEWRDDFLGTGKMVESRGINVTGGRVEVNLTRKGAGGTGEYEAYPALAFAGGSNDVTIYYPNAGRTDWGTDTHFNTGNQNNAVLFDDVDGDGYLDLLIGYGSANLHVHWGDSAGTWSQTRETVITAGYIDHVATGDFDGDGDIDIALACDRSGGSTDSLIFYGSASRSFSSSADVTLTGQEYIRVDSGDVNSDGYDDLVFAAGSVARLFLGGPSGIPTTRDREYTAAGLQDVYLGHLDDDGDLDLLLGCKLSGKSLVFMGSPSGPDTTADYQLTIPGANLYAVTAGDINGDGYKDIVTFSGTNPSNDAHYFEGSASGWSDSNMHNGFAGGYNYAMMALDVDKDGYDDVIVANWASGNPTFRLYKGGTTWPTTPSKTYSNAHNFDVAAAVPKASGGRLYRGTFTTESITIGSDKKWDLLFVEGTLPKNTTMTLSVLDSTGEPLPGYEDLTDWDVDLSGITRDQIIQVEVKITSEFNWTTPVLDRITVKWMAKGYWREQFYGAAKIERLVNADVTGGQLESNVQWHEEGVDQLVFTSIRGDEGYNTRPSIVQPWGGSVTALPLDVAGTSAVAKGDVNGDGLTDLVFAVHRTSDTTYRAKSPLFLGHPTGFAPKPGNEFPTVGAMAVVLEDLNNDGHQDVVFAQEWDGTAYRINSTLFWGGASGWNATPDVEFVTNGAADVEAADIDGDGWLDLVFACYSDGSTSTDSMVFLQDSAGYCGTVPSYRLATQGARGVAVGDIDNDGHPDVVFANSFSGGSTQIDSYVYWGKASGGFETTPGTLPTVGAEDVALGNFDQLGGLDIAFANFKNNLNNHSIDSYIFLGTGTRTLITEPAIRVPTVGAIAVMRLMYDDVGPDDIVFACSYDGLTFDVASVVTSFPYDSTHTNRLPTVGATDVIAGGIMPGNKAAYMSKVISPEDWTQAGSFHTFKYTSTLKAGVTGKVQLIDATTWEVLVETALAAGSNEWVVDGSFSLKDHPRIRVLIAAGRVDNPDDFVLDDLWLNWTARAKLPPSVLDVEMSPSSLLRMKAGTMRVNVTDEYDLPDELRLSVEHRLQGTTVWGSNLLGAPTFANGTWTLSVFGRADAPVGLYDIRVNVTDNDGKFSGFVEFEGVLELLNNVPGAPVVKIMPEAPLTTTSIRVEIVTPATDVETGVSYRYTWYKDGTAVENLTADTVTSAYTAKGENWSVEVSAFDGIDEGPPALASVIIRNAPPQVAIPLPNPEFPEDTVDDRWLDLGRSFSDPDGDALTYAVSVAPKNITVTIDPATGKVTLTPARNWYGQESATFVASDGELSQFQTVLITVTPVNDAPRFTTLNGQPITTDPVNFSVEQGGLLVITVGAEDVEGDRLVFSVNTTAVDVDPDTGEMRFEPGNEAVGTVRYAITMYDEASQNVKVRLNITITVINRNDPPGEARITNPPSGEKYKVNQTFSLIGTCTDPDTPFGQVLNYTWYWNGTHLLGYGSSLTVKFDNAGNYTITLNVTDGEYFREASVAIEITPRETPQPPPPPPPPPPDEGPGIVLWIGLLVALVIIGGVIFLVASRKRAAEEEQAEEVDEQREALRRMATAARETAEQMERELGEARAAPAPAKPPEFEEIRVEGVGGPPVSRTGLSMGAQVTEQASKEVQALFEDVGGREVEAPSEETEAMRLEGLQRKYQTAISRLPYGIPSPELKERDWSWLAGALATGQKKMLPDGREVTRVEGRWYYSDVKDASSFLKEHGAKPRAAPTARAAAAPTADKATLLARLEERFVLGEISEASYRDLKRKLEAEGAKPRPRADEWVEEE